MARFFCVESPFVDHCFLEEGERLDNGVRAFIRLRPELTNSWGGAHGGLTTTLLDASMSVAARYALAADGSRNVATIDMATTFIGKASKLLTCEAYVTSVKGRTVFTEAKARNEEQEIVARATGTFRAI